MVSTIKEKMQLFIKIVFCNLHKNNYIFTTHSTYEINHVIFRITREENAWAKISAKAGNIFV